MKKYALIFLTIVSFWGCGRNASTREETSMDARTTASSEEYQKTEAPADLKLDELKGGGNEQKREIPTNKDLPKEKGDFQQVKDTQKAPQDTIDIGTQIIRTANINIQVKEFKEGTDKIRQVVKANGGYISSSNEQNNGYSIQGEMSVRIASKNFDKAVKELLAIAVYVNSKSENAEDVTEEFIDIMTRLKTKKEVEKRYLEILGQARTIVDILEVEEKLRMIREEIEAKEGQLKYLKDQVRFSTIRLTYYQTNEKYEKAPEPSFFSKIGDALVDGWQGLLMFFVGLAYFWPAFILIAVAVWWWKKVWKKKKAANNKQDIA